MQKFNTEAVVLKSFKYKDSDKIYTIFSKTNGKISALAKGVRKINSRRSGNLDTLNHIDIQLSDSYGDLKYISEVKTLNAYQNIKDNFFLLKKVYYVLELLDKSLHEDENSQEIFLILIKLLDKLNADDTSGGSILKYINGFELVLMKKLGYSPPASFLKMLKSYTSNNDYLTADRLIKEYVQDNIGEKFESLSF